MEILSAYLCLTVTGCFSCPTCVGRLLRFATLLILPTRLIYEMVQRLSVKSISVVES